MGSFVFQWPHEGSEVYVKGSFDGWKQQVKLDKSDDTFKKEVELPKVDEKIYYKFVVDGNWKIDDNALKEADSNNNINNVLLPEHIKKPDQSTTAPTEGPAATEMSGVTPESTTAALAAEVPKKAEEVPETSNAPEPEAEGGPVPATISSAAPDSTTAALAKDAPLEHPPPGTFPETPAKEPEQFSVNPLPATAGIGNPIQLKPGETVPDPSTLTENNVTSGVTTDKAGYERDASAPGMSAIPDIVIEPSTADPVPTIQSAAPTSTTAALAGAVPLEARSDVKSGPAIPKDESAGGPEPTTTTEAAETAPAPPAPIVKEEQVSDLSPKSKEPATSHEEAAAGVGKAAGPETPAPKQETTVPADAAASPTTPPEDTSATDKKKKKKYRASGIFQKLKEKFNK